MLYTDKKGIAIFFDEKKSTPLQHKTLYKV